MRAIQSLPSTLANAEYDLLCYHSSRRTPVEFLVATAIPAIGNGRYKLDFITSVRERKGAASRVVEVEWAKFTLFFSPRKGRFSKKCHI